MEDEQQTQTESSQAETGPYYGEPLLTWEVDEYPQAQRSRRWYVLASLLAVALIVYAVATANFLFAVIILLAGIFVLITSFTSPQRIEIIATSLGLVVGDKFYEYKDIRDFSIAYNPPAAKILYVSFRSPFTPLLSIPLEDTDPNDVRDCLGASCNENLERTEETLTDRLRRVYKL